MSDGSDQTSFFFFWPGRRVVSTGCLARSAAMELKMWFQRERTDIDPHGGVCVRPENATRGSQGRISWKKEVFFFVFARLLYQYSYFCTACTWLYLSGWLVVIRYKYIHLRVLEIVINRSHSYKYLIIKIMASQTLESWTLSCHISAV